MATNLFSRERLAGYSPDALQSATVLCVGAGALGQNVLTNLALAGIGEIRVIDFDEFEPHNRTRSPHYPSPSEQVEWGLAKARVVSHKVGALMQAEVSAMRYAVAPVQALGAGAFEGVDVAIAAVDNPRARAYLSDTCRWLGIPLVEGGFDGPSVTMSYFPATDPDHAGSEPCYRCGNPGLVGTFSCQRYAEHAEAAGVMPAIQTAAATLGGVMVEAAIQAVHGKHPLAFQRSSLEIRTHQFRRYTLALNPHCPGVHSRLSQPPTRLPVGAGDDLVTLLEAVEGLTGDGSRIKLPTGLVLDAFCLGCDDRVGVGAPEWAYDANPRCQACGGPWTPLGRPAGGYTPSTLPVLDHGSPPGALALGCAEAGLPAGAIFETDHEDDGAFQLAGVVGDLYQVALL